MRIHPKAVAKMKRRIKELTARSNGMSNDSRIDKLKSYIMGKLLQNSGHEEFAAGY